jgi:multicomponent Na+:H+ antiporter subunit C
MIQSTFFYTTAIILFLIGLYGVLTKRNVIKTIVTLTIMETAVNLFLVTIGYVEGGTAPILTSTISDVHKFVDPLPQALVLTSIVIGLGTTALMLSLAIRLYKKYKTLNYLEMDGEDEK